EEGPVIPEVPVMADMVGLIETEIQTTEVEIESDTPVAEETVMAAEVSGSLKLKDFQLVENLR
ncbi:MAG: hypothetical protein ACE5RO_05505, partial [Candidatus Nitrosomaritimum yanchengensis]